MFLQYIIEGTEAMMDFIYQKFSTYFFAHRSEVFEVSEAIQGLILERATSSEIQKAAQAEGMITMHDDGYLKALQGLTTLNEVNRVSAAEGA